MSNNNNHKNNSCAAAEQMVSYLYGETDSTEKIEFETHLHNCFVCADEFADFGSIRSSIQEWRSEEFLNIPTPFFEVPINQDKRSDSSNHYGWLAKLSRLFTLNPALGMAAFAVVAVFTGLLFFALKSSQTDEMAKTDDNKSSIQTNVSPTVEKVAVGSKDEFVNNDAEKPLTEQKPNSISKESKNLQPQTMRGKQTTASESEAKISINSLPNKPDNSQTNRNVKAVNKPNKKSPFVQKPQVPIYSSTEDEEDKSVRLADLFDEIDTK